MHDKLNSASLTNKKSGEKKVFMDFVCDTDEINHFELQRRIPYAVDRCEKLLVQQA